MWLWSEVGALSFHDYVDFFVPPADVLSAPSEVTELRFLFAPSEDALC